MQQNAVGGLFFNASSRFQALTDISDVDPTKVVAIGISSTIGLAVLLSMKASRSLAILCLLASGRIMEPAPIIRKAQSIKVTGINAHKVKKTPFSLLTNLPIHIENAVMPPAFLTSAIKPLNRYRKRSTCRLPLSDITFTAFVIAVSNPPMTEWFSR